MTKKQLGRTIVCTALLATALVSSPWAQSTDMTLVAANAGHAVQRIADALHPETSGMIFMGLVLMGTIIHRRIKSKAG